MSATLILADLIVKTPCYGVEEGTWEWWRKFCWVYQIETWLAIGLSVTLALLAASAMRMWRQKWIAA